MEPVHELQIYEGSLPPMRADDVRRQINLIQEIMRDAMKDGEHYGKIPGCGPKPTLLKAGAEKLNLTFRMAPHYLITRHEMPNGHREYEVRCNLTSIGSEKFLGEGIGSCSTMESKYRYRNVADYEITGESLPQDYKEKKADYRRQGFGAKKVDGVWEWVKFTDAEKAENPDIADTYNTVLKMAKKRALVDAVLTVTAASDIFTQDIEDLPASVVGTGEPPPAPTTKTPPKTPPAASPAPEEDIKEPSLAELKSKAIAAAKKLGFEVDDLEGWLEVKQEDWGKDEIARVRQWYSEQKAKQNGAAE
jgi:hypothetical protein